MINTLFLPELREMLVEDNTSGLREFCTALHPARTAEFMEGLESSEAWRVLQHADRKLRAEIFSYFDYDRQLEMLERENERQVADLITHVPADDACDLLSELPDSRVEQVLALVPAPDRRDIRRLQTFAEGTAGSIMTTEAACLDERLTVREALEQLSRQAEHVETIYYIYVVDETNHLRGVVSTRMLVSSFGKQQTTLAELMDTDILTVQASDDQQDVANIVAKYDLLAIPVVDAQRHMLGIITHDDVIDVVLEEAAEDVQRIAAVEPLKDSYARTPILTLTWKRGMWLGILFFAGLLTALALRSYETEFESFAWLVWFIPLIIGSGGNSGAQSSTLIIAAMATGDVKVSDWMKIIYREVATGVLLGIFLGVLGLIPAMYLAPTWQAGCIVPITVFFVVICGTFSGSILPLLFQRLGWDPALMSNPFVAGINDLLGIVVYVNIARLILGPV
ncbi:magnesium transporter [Aureliella helgolandensis]|uniref:Magnesium transporter MgtE n=1 Tax=Aureliella helgolandensis TaxID=2527968 RepID=A0A518GEJ9_9BACT|nr:magnesium transporter [Aureliella helgolandensis]QDV27024.1 Magnesium transporter MgtE [Aureliella helgolandensis]